MSIEANGGVKINSPEEGATTYTGYKGSGQATADCYT